MDASGSRAAAMRFQWRGGPRTCLIAHHDIAGGDPDAYDIGDAIMAFWGPAFYRRRSDPWVMAAIR
jgi:hypothetical protein